MTPARSDQPQEATPGPSKPRRFLSRLLAVACWGYLGAVLAGWLLLFQADRWWPATFLMFGPRLLFVVPGILLLLLVLVARRPGLLVPVVLAGLVAAGPLSGGCVPWRPLLVGPSAGLKVRVMTCNMHYAVLPSDRLEELVLEANPDVVALQEWDPRNRSGLLTGSGWYTHRRPHLFLASRYPLRAVEVLGARSESDRGAVARYELETPLGIVTLFSLHLASPRQGIYETLHDDRRGPDTIEENTALRWWQSRGIADDARQVRGPVLLAGDFNTPPESRLFREVWTDYLDAFGEAGWGWGYTFYGARTAVRIDHILAGRGWRCRRCWVGRPIGSPHRPVLADLVWSGRTDAGGGN